MSGLDIEKLLSALEDEENADLLNLDMKKIAAEKNDILTKLELPKSQQRDLLKKLKQYRYIDELPGMKYGSYIRWISLKNPENLKLTNGGIVCEMKVGDNGIVIVCKNNFNRFFQLNMTETLIFQKLNEEELVLLSALDYINSNA
tara:strand:- start:3498 stop:3932 length:435 start_codon:yes stop_codon:yes gene_type:complete